MSNSLITPQQFAKDIIDLCNKVADKYKLTKEQRLELMAATARFIAR